MWKKTSYGLKSFLWTLVLLFFLAGCDSQSPSTEKANENKVRPAKLYRVTPSDSDIFLNYPAVIQSQQLSTLSFEVGGIVKEIMVVEAQKVDKGEVLAKLDQRDLTTKLKSAQAQYENSDSEYQRAVRLIKGDAISRSTLEQRKFKRDVDKAQLETAQKALQDTVLISPYPGNIAKISIQEQQAIQPGNTAITLLGTGGLEATINLPSAIIALAKEDDENKTQSYLTLDVAPEQRIPAVFKEVSLEADTASQTYEVTFTFSEQENLNILPGMNGTLWFRDPRRLAGYSPEGTALKIPLTAIMADGEKNYVWVVNPESMKVVKREVSLSDGVGEKLNVASGLEAGETIVAAGVSYLSEGMEVRPWSK